MKTRISAIAASLCLNLFNIPVYAEVDYVKCEAMDNARQRLFQSSAIELVRANSRYEAVMQTPGGSDPSSAEIRIFYKRLEELRQGKGESEAVAVMKKITAIDKQMKKIGCPTV